MKKISIPVSLFLALLPLSGKAQSLIPKLKGSESVTAETPKGATTTASYTIGSSPSKSTVIRPGNKAGGAAVRPAVSNKRVSVPRAEREIPDAKVSKAYTQEVRTNVHFRVNRTELDLAYLENGQTLTELFEMLNKVGIINIQSVEIVSTASPEGSLSHNQELAEGRCNTLAYYVTGEYPALSGKVIKSPDGESWTQLRRYVEKDRNLSSESKSLIYGILEREHDLDRRELLLKQSGSAPEVGGIYSYLFRNYFPLIRNTGIYVTTSKKED